MSRWKESSTIRIIRNTFNLKSLQFVLSLLFTLIAIIGIIIFGSILYSGFIEEIKNHEYDATKEVTDQVATNIELHLKNIIELSDFIHFKLFMSNDIQHSEFCQMLDIMFRTYDDLISLHIYDTHGQCVLEHGKANVPENIIDVDTPWYNITKESRSGSFFNVITTKHKVNSVSSKMIALSKRIKYYSTDKDMDGVMILLINFKSVDEMLGQSKLGKNGYVFIVDTTGNIIYHPKRELIDLGLATENSYEIAAKPGGVHMLNNTLYYVKNMQYCQWKMVGVSYMEGIVKTQTNINNLLIWLVLLSILLIFLISIFVAARISHPINKLKSSMNKVTKGILDVQLDLKGEEEFIQLSDAFNTMVKQIKLLMEQIVKEQEAKKKTEFTALQEQINPHFLYNTFDSVIWMAEKGRIQDVKTMIVSLSSMLRISLSKGKGIITVKEELTHVENYLKIQKIRYQDKLDYRITADDNVLSFKTLKLIVQPFVENAILHGIDAMVDQGIIEIDARIDDNALVFQIHDNGIGIGKKELLKITKAYKSFKSSGIGIQNVHQRIQLYFGKQYGVEVLSEIESGTTVLITLPLLPV